MSYATPPKDCNELKFLADNPIYSSPTLREPGCRVDARSVHGLEDGDPVQHLVAGA